MKHQRGYGTPTLRRFLSWPLRTHLLLMALFLAFPAILLIVFSGLNKKKESIREGIAAGNKLSARIAMEQYNIVGDAKQLATVLSQLPEIRVRDLSGAGAILGNILRLSPQYANIVIADKEGEVWASALPLKEKQSLRGRRSFLHAIRSRQFSSGEHNLDIFTKKATIGFGYPVLAASGEVKDVILVSLNFGNLKQALGEIGLPGGAVYSIIDHNGFIIDRNLDAQKAIGRRVNPQLARQMEECGEEGNFIDSDPTGEKYLYTSRKLRLTGEEFPYLSILTSIPLRETQEKAKQALINNIAILSPFLLLSFALVQRLGTVCFVGPIDRLREAAHRLADGELEVRASELVSGGELWELGEAFDQMAAKLRLRGVELVKSERELDDLYNKAPCGYHSLDKDGAIVRINDTELSWLGYAREDIVGKIHFTAIITPAGVAAYVESFATLKKEGMIRDLEFDMVRKDGTLFPVLLNASAIYDADGAFLASRSTTFDITERTLVARRLTELNQNLSKRVEDETERRLRHERLLARHTRLAALGEMLEAIAHQWRQPLATLGATIQSIGMAREQECLDTAFLLKAEMDAQKQLYYMSDTIEDFRNFFRQDKVTERFDAVEKGREAVILIHPQFTHAGVTLRISVVSQGEALEIRGYQNEFKQALLNLVSNSFDAIMERRERGDTQFDGLVEITFSGSADSVVIQVRDNGCGIPPEYGDKVFDPYFTSKSGSKGTGIGLYMCRLIIQESMAGTLGFTSGQEGTTFRMLLPRDFSPEGAPHG